MSVVQVALLLAAVSCHALANPGNYFYGGAASHLGEQYAYPKYNYDYGVHSPHTGDVKNQWETRDGDVVKGSYSFNEADGTIRQVEYTADEHNGFNAVVKKLGKAVHPHAVRHYGGTGLGGAYNGGERYEAGHLGSSSYVSVKHASGHQPGSYYGTQKLGGAFFGAGHLGEASSYANGNLNSFSHYGGHMGGHFAGATSHANSNSLSINHYGAPRYSVGHLGVTSYAGGYNGAVGHHGNHHYY